ncbi:MAG: hypothetical protein AB7O32_16295 [Vicinamibacterales bacterium]
MLELAVRGGVALALASAACLAAHAGADRIAPGADTPTRWVTAGAILGWGLTALFHLLSAFGAFALPAAAFSILAIAAATIAPDRARTAASIRRDLRYARRAWARLRRSPSLPIVVAFFVCAAQQPLRALILPPLGWDTLTYHSVKAASWVQQGHAYAMDGPGPWAYYQHMLAGAEVFVAWAMLPMHADTLVQLVDIAAWLFMGLAVIVLARRLGAREPFGSTAAGFVMAIPTVRLMMGSVYVEPTLLASLAAGLALAASASARRPGLLVVAGGILGVSAATKLPMLPVTAVPLVIVCVFVIVRAWPRARLSAVGAIAAFAIALAPWLLRAWMATGAPLSPLPVTIAGVELGKAPPELAWYMDRSPNEPVQARTEGDVLRLEFAPPRLQTEALGIFAVLPFALLPVGLFAAVRRQPLAVAVVAAAAIACVTGYYSPSLALVRHFFAINSSRFLLPAALCATVLSVSWCRRDAAAGVYRGMLVAATLWYLLQYTWVGASPDSVEAMFGVFAGLAVVAGLWRLAALLPLGAIRIGARAVVLVLAIAALDMWRGIYRYELFAGDFALHGFGSARYWAPAVPAVDDPAVPRRIAVTSGPHRNLDNWFVYPFMGRTLQNEVTYVPIATDERIRHFGGGDLNETRAGAASYPAWMARLRDQRISDVVSFTPPSIELEWMEQHPEAFERVAGRAGSWGVFHVRVAGAAGDSPVQ